MTSSGGGAPPLERLVVVSLARQSHSGRHHWPTETSASILELDSAVVARLSPVMKSSSSVRQTLVFVLLIVACRGLRAQGAPPPAPDTVLKPSSGQPEYMRSLHEIAPPVIIAQHPYRVMLAPAATAAALDAADILDALSRACPSREKVSAPPGYAPGGIAMDATKYVVVIASSASSAEQGCEDGWNTSAFAIWSGLSFGGHTRSIALIPRALRLLANGVPVEPAFSVSRPALELEGAQWRRGQAQLRYYYPMSVLASSASGKRPELVVQVWETRGISTSFDLAVADGERMQYAYAVWRLATATGPTQPVRLTPRRPVKSDVREVLDLAATRADSGALRAAEMLARTPSTKANEHDRDVATLLVAEVLGQRRDSMAARGLLTNVRARRSCLASPRGGSAALVAAIAATRMRACPEHNPLATLGAGIVIPGGGHWMHGSKLVGVLATAALSSIFVTAYAQDATARSTYARYEGSRLAKEATDLFKLSNTQRASARRLAQVGLAISASDAVLSSFITAAQNREVARGRL
jgi:hypothetical protein